MATDTSQLHAIVPKLEQGTSSSLMTGTVLIPVSSLVSLTQPAAQQKPSVQNIPITAAITKTDKKIAAKPEITSTSIDPSTTSVSSNCGVTLTAVTVVACTTTSAATTTSTTWSNSSHALCRSPNYTEWEKKVLLDLCVEYIDIVEGRRVDKAALEAKEDTWKHITKRFNETVKLSSESEKYFRTTLMLKTAYTNMKRRRRKELRDSEWTSNSETPLGRHIDQQLARVLKGVPDSSLANGDDNESITSELKPDAKDEPKYLFRILYTGQSPSTATPIYSGSTEITNTTDTSPEYQSSMHDVSSNDLYNDVDHEALIPQTIISTDDDDSDITGRLTIEHDFDAHSDDKMVDNKESHAVFVEQDEESSLKILSATTHAGNPLHSSYSSTKQENVCHGATLKQLRVQHARRLFSLRKKILLKRMIREEELHQLRVEWLKAKIEREKH